MNSFTRIRLLLALFVVFRTSAFGEPAVIRADFGKIIGQIRALNGVNRGPVAAGGRVKVIEQQKALGLHSIRTHDSHWPNSDVVDIHAVFPDSKADPSKPESYDFPLTDEYLDGIRKTGAAIIYRLGETIEHTSKKRYVYPPRDNDRWAQICLGIIRHYNQGWANGFHYGIQYWEIWNEPENRPVMWTGNDKQFLRLYKTAAIAIKHAFPNLKVGGPAFGSYIQINGEAFKPVPFTAAFLEMCQTESVPLDFFSWHCYTDNPAELSMRAKFVRRLLNSYGFEKTESHLNEWNLLPGNTWNEGNTGEEKDQYFSYLAGPAGAAFLTTALSELQDAPVDVSNIFHAELGNMGFFTMNGTPHKNYYGMLAFRRLLDLGNRVEATGAVSGQVGVLAAINSEKTEAAILISNYRGSSEFRFQLQSVPTYTDREVLIVNETHKLESTTLLQRVEDSPLFNLDLKAPAVALVLFHSRK
jgi:xylan 1,4-beta-xylosidase